MQIKSYENVKKLQEGGALPADSSQGAAPAPASAQGRVEEQLAQLAQQLVEMLMQQIGDPQAVMMVLQMAAEMLQGAQQPVGAVPEEGQAFMRKGGKIMKCGAKMKSKKACGGAKLSK